MKLKGAPKGCGSGIDSFRLMGFGLMEKSIVFLFEFDGFTT